MRSEPSYSSGVLPTVVSGQQDAFIAVIEAQLTAFQSNGADAWQEADDLSGTYFDKVFHSVGDRSLGSGSNIGDTDIWVRLTQYGTGDDFQCRVYQDWSPTSSTGYREAYSGSFNLNMDDTQGIEWFCVVNEYEFVFIWKQGGSFKMLHFGQPVPTVSDKMGGVARTTSQSGTGDSVVFGLDRDISAGIKVGQYVWLVNQTPDATSLQSVGVDLVEVTAVTANSVTVDGVTNTYANGSLVGWDPVPTFCKQSYTAGGYFVSQLNGNWASTAGQASTFENPLATALNYSDFVPGIDQLYYGSQPYFEMTTGVLGFRGKSQLMRAFTHGHQADKDLAQVDFESAQQWKLLGVSETASLFSGYVLAIGPGAT